MQARLLQITRPRMAVTAPLDELFPHVAGVLGEHHRGIRIRDIPETRVDFLRQLAWLPADEAREIARVVRCLLDDPVERFGVGGEEKIAEHAHRTPAWIALHQ